MGGVKNRDCRFQAELCMQQAAENCEQHRAAFEAFPGSLRIHIYVEELVGQLSLENSLDSNREFEKGCKSYRSPCEACMYIVCMYVFASQLKPFLLMHTYHIHICMGHAEGHPLCMYVGTSYCAEYSSE